jgi:hypothetical protein
MDIAGAPVGARARAGLLNLRQSKTLPVAFRKWDAGNIVFWQSIADSGPAPAWIYFKMLLATAAAVLGYLDLRAFFLAPKAVVNRKNKTQGSMEAD